MTDTNDDSRFERETTSELPGFDRRTADETPRHERPTIRDVVANHPRAETRVYRLAEAMEFEPDEVFTALERVQRAYDAFETARERPIVDHGGNYVAFGFNGADWYSLFEFIKRGIDDDDKSHYIAMVVTKVMSDITGEDWHAHNSVPLVLSEQEVADVLAYHREMYDTQ